MLSNDPAAVDRAISALNLALTSTKQAALVLTDLASAHLRRAQKHQSARDLLVAIDAAAQAVDLEPENGPALFNLALGLHWFGLELEARTVWRQYLSTDSISEWADEARNHVDKLYAAAAAYSHVPPLSMGTQVPSRAALIAYANAVPEEARTGGQALLEQWGRGLLNGDSIRASALLWQVGILADELERQGGDATLGDAVRAIRGHAANPAATRELACGYVLLAAGRDAIFRGDHVRAGRIFFRVHISRRSPESLRMWATLSLAAALQSQDSMENAQQVLQEFVTQLDTIRRPAFAAIAQTEIGTFLLDRGRYGEAKERLGQALRSSERIGDHDRTGKAQLSLARTEFKLGNVNAAYEQFHRALGNVLPFRQSNFDVLYFTTQLALSEGLTHAAIRIQNEGLESVARSGGQSAAMARLSRARALSASGKSSDAIQDVERARFSLEAFRRGPGRAEFEAEVLLVEAHATLRDQPRRAAIMLDSAIRSGLRPDQLAEALTLRSEARIALGQLDSAANDLDHAAKLLSEPSNTSEPLIKRFETSYRNLVMQYVSMGRDVDALELVEKRRTGVTSRENMKPTADNSRLRGPPKETLIEYLIIGDTLLTWTVAGSEINLTRSTISRHALSRTIAAVKLALELRQSDDLLRPHLQLLHDWLIRPVQTRVGPSGTPLVIVTDGEIGNIPFSALWDSRRGRYLLEDHMLRFARSLEDALSDEDQVRTPAKTVLIVADPAFDTHEYAGLQRLPAARAEADSISLEYPSYEIITDVHAHELAVETALRRATILHFAGHAFYDGEHPAQSFLLLAPLSTLRDSDGWSAEKIQRLDLRHVKLVVLAGCETLRSESSWPNGFRGLAAALRNAGVGGVIGSRWRVSDDLTRTLMIRFHRAYRGEEDAAGALRAAQLSSLRSPDPIHRSVTAWAGFEYMGN